MHFRHFSFSVHMCGDVWFSILRRKTHHHLQRLSLDILCSTPLSSPKANSMAGLKSFKKETSWVISVLHKGGLKIFLLSKNSDPSICSGDSKEAFQNLRSQQNLLLRMPGGGIRALEECLPLMNYVNWIGLLSFLVTARLTILFIPFLKNL